MLPNLPFGTLISSKQLVSGNHINGFNQLLTGTATGIVALAGGGFAGAPALNSAFNELTTVATIGDSVALPPAKSGLRVTIINSGAQQANVFPQPADVINAGGAGVQVTLAAAATAMFVAVKDGVWKRFVSA
jgi:hypothetical protein